MNKEKEYNKQHFHQCPLCHFEVEFDSEFGLVITKGVLKRIFFHEKCYNKLLKRRKQ